MRTSILFGDDRFRGTSRRDHEGVAMTESSRRDMFKLGTVAGLSLLAPTALAASPGAPRSLPSGRSRGVEGQRRADLGNGTYQNPILAGDNPDPSVVKD